MPTVSELARVTTRDGAIWRPCRSCGVLAPLAPNTHHCQTCTTPPTPDEALSTVDGVRALRSIAALLNEIPETNATALDRADWFTRKAEAFQAVAAAVPELAEEATRLAVGARQVAEKLRRGWLA